MRKQLTVMMVLVSLTVAGSVDSAKTRRPKPYGCYEGLRVGGDAESVGRLTTRSVVESIFLVIVLDAMFSILFAELGI